MSLQSHDGLSVNVFILSNMQTTVVRIILLVHAVELGMLLLSTTVMMTNAIHMVIIYTSNFFLIHYFIATI